MATYQEEKCSRIADELLNLLTEKKLTIKEAQETARLFRQKCEELSGQLWNGMIFERKGTSLKK